MYAQETMPKKKPERDIYSLIDKYSQAREKKDSVLLKSILMTDIDQLVSSGEWRMSSKSPEIRISVSCSLHKP